MKHILGEKTKETIHRENNVLLKLNIETSYYSPRSATERKRIMKLVKAKERVLVMFSGIAPFVSVIAKNTDADEVIGVELNPKAHEYAEKNILLNKLKNAKVLLGDVRKIVPSLGQFDRIAMPLPKSAEDYLDIALGAVRKGAVIHFYDFQEEGKFELAVKKIDKACKKARRDYKVLHIQRCGSHSPRTFRICADFVMSN